MDTNNKLNETNGKKGFVVVWFVIAIPVILLFALMAIDFGYMYMAKGQLQNAADSAALAGAGVMSGGGTQGMARAEAKKFGLANQAATQNIIIEDSNISFAHWNPVTKTCEQAGTPIDAIQVTAARNTSSAGGAIPIIFGKYFGWDKMGASATACAAFSPRGTLGLSICLDTCKPEAYIAPAYDVYSSVTKKPKVLETGPVSASASSDQLFAWTSFDLKTTAPGNDLINQICSQESVNAGGCGQLIYSTMGGPTNALKHLEAQMYNPNYDRVNKTFDAGNNVTSWSVIVPIVTGDGINPCKPGAQGNSWDPKEVKGFAKLQILAICTSGGGNIGSTCSNYSAPANYCNALETMYGLPKLSNNIIIRRIQCVNCPDVSSLMPGLKPYLVR